jgi:hypothetical protein
LSFFRFASVGSSVAVLAIGAAAVVVPAAAYAGGGDNGDNGGQQYDKGKDNGPTQSVHGGDQDASQTNDSSVTQNQGNHNVNFAPVFVYTKGDSSNCGCDSKGDYNKNKGDDGATTSNYQGNGNEANAWVLQGNFADQSQRANQDQSSNSAGQDSWKKDDRGKDNGPSQSAEGGDQTASQTNSSSVDQDQGNKNWNLSPAVDLGSSYGKDGQSCGCQDSNKGWDEGTSTSNAQGNGNEANAGVFQLNLLDQSQHANQNQVSNPSGDEDWNKDGQSCGCDEYDKGSDNGGEQSVHAGDQTADQTNSSDVTQKQGNHNVNVSPAISLFGGHASTYNSQGNGNEANAVVLQGNSADQSQQANQTSTSDDDHSAAADQTAKGGDQDATQSNSSSVTQKQGNGNVNVSPALGLFGGNATTHNSQGNGNEANSFTAQGNSANQSQTAHQTSGDAGA